ncbi:MAG: glutamate--cysteine ligase [Rubrivivax sp.]|nr:glutamate--cysteine ligase [Rubrivivax sp.]
MTSSLSERLRALGSERMAGMKRGIEKESLRIDASGALALTPHPAALGSALTHPCITTDFCESQLELITAAHTSAEACAAELAQIHQFVAQTLGDERMWVASMPCQLPPDETIPIGRYGGSNIGRAKSVYRMGLGLRYGRRMQTISGIHYNWSLPGLDNTEYFSLIRNFRRHSFVLLRLFGASPAVCACFVEGRKHALEALGPDTFGLPQATSLRMGRLGYQSDAQAALNVSYNSLSGYAASLHGALTTPHPPYEAIGVRNLGGEYNQLATSLLQIENEFYGTIRPKRTIRMGERPLHALRERGVEYVEVRCMDLDPFEPAGISAQTMRFLDVFLLHCLLSDSPPDTPEETVAIARNQHQVASHGRDPALLIQSGSDPVSMADWGARLIAECLPLAEQLDEVLGTGSRYRQALEAAAQQWQQPETAPSARLLQALRSDFGGSFQDLVKAQSEQTRQHWQSLPLEPEVRSRLQVASDVSLREQRRREAADSLPFEDYRLQYLAPERLLV